MARRPQSVRTARQTGFPHTHGCVAGVLAARLVALPSEWLAKAPWVFRPVGTSWMAG